MSDSDLRAWAEAHADVNPQARAVLALLDRVAGAVAAERDRGAREAIAAAERNRSCPPSCLCADGYHIAARIWEGRPDPILAERDALRVELDLTRKELDCAAGAWDAEVADGLRAIIRAKDDEIRELDREQVETLAEWQAETDAMGRRVAALEAALAPFAAVNIPDNWHRDCPITWESGRHHETGKPRAWIEYLAADCETIAPRVVDYRRAAELLGKGVPQ